MKFWQYITSTIGILCTAVLLVTNVLAAWDGTDSDVWRAIMVSISVAADMGLIGFLFAIIANHRGGAGAAVFLSFLVWAACGLYTGIQSTRWLESQFSSMAAPGLASENTRRQKLRYLDTEIAKSREFLAAAEQVAINASTQLKRDSAKTQVEQTRERIADLERQKWPVSIEASRTHVKHTFVGFEWAFPLTVLLVSQISWYVTFGSVAHGFDPEPMRPVTKPSQPMRPEPDQNVFTLAIDRPPEPIEPLKTNDETIHEPKTNHGGFNGSNVVHLQTTADSVLTMVRDGLSERVIAAKLGIPRSRVQRIKTEARKSVAAAE